jgi:hypothetical protein
MIGADSPRSVAQLVEHRSPKPAVGGSIPSGPVGVVSRESFVVSRTYAVRSTQLVSSKEYAASKQ